MPKTKSSSASSLPSPVCPACPDEEASREVLRSLDRALTAFAGLDEFLVPPAGVTEARMAAAAAAIPPASAPGLHTDLLLFAARFTACLRAMGLPRLDGSFS